jgi:hypothetical protein
MDLELTSRPSPVRCAVCHDELATAPVPCDGCGAALHAECRAAVHGCPTIGCRNRLAPVVEAAEGKGDRERARARRLGVVALFNGAAALYMAGFCHLLLGRAPPESTLPSSPVALAFGGSALVGALTLVLAVRSWRRSWLGTAALAMEIAWLILTGPQLLELLAWSRPLTEAEVQEFTARFKARDEAAHARVDVGAMIAVHDPERDRLSYDEREQLQRLYHWQQHSLAEQLHGDGGSLRVLHGGLENGPRLVLRALNRDLGVSYQELLLARGKDGQATCVDSLEVRTNDAWAAVHMRMNRLTRGKRAALVKIVQLANDGDLEAALATYEELPEATRLDRDFLAARLYVAQELDTERHVAALEALIAACPGELEVLRWELAVAREDERAALAALDAIDRRVGGDPFLDGLRAEAHSALGEHVRAMELANRVTETLPDLEGVYWILLGCAVEARDHRRTRYALERLTVTFHHPVSEVEGAVDLTDDFFASEDGEKWKNWTR